MKNCKDYSEIVPEILALVEDGHDILEIEMGGQNNFFLVEGFEPPVGGTVHTAPYLQFTGMLINDFLNNSIYSQIDATQFLSRFNIKYSPKDTRRNSFKFSEKHIWRFYSK